MITVLDSTLREGEQTPGVYFDAHIKMAVAGLLDRIGVGIIEAGHPVVAEDIRQGITTVAKGSLRALIGAHARSLQSDIEAALACGVGFVGIFYCVSDERLKDHATTLIAAIDRIAGVIAYAKERQPKLLVRYTPEDTVRSPWKNVVAIASEAVRAGADIISIADTTGHMVPGGDRDMYDWVSRFREELARSDLYPRIAVHCHNDRGLALANALAGLRAGAAIVDASVLGLGERAGIVDLATLLAVLSQEWAGAGEWNLELLPELYQLVSRYAGVPIPVHFPVVGRNAFSHCAGVHSQAALRNPLHYQSLDPALFGRQPEITLDHMSGMSALQHSLDRIHEPIGDRELLAAIQKRIKEIGLKGRTVSLEELKCVVTYERSRLSAEELACSRTA